jgi:hypothetical protein
VSACIFLNFPRFNGCFNGRQRACRWQSASGDFIDLIDPSYESHKCSLIWIGMYVCIHRTVCAHAYV